MQKIYIISLAPRLAVVWYQVYQNSSLLTKSVIAYSNCIQQFCKYNKTDHLHQSEHLEPFANQMQDKQYFQDCFEIAASHWLRSHMLWSC